MRATELNRGLERARAAAGEDRIYAMGEEWKRNALKVGHILDTKQERLGDQAVFDVAENAPYRLSGNLKPATETPAGEAGVS
jgi:hypothetical protein